MRPGFCLRHDIPVNTWVILPPVWRCLNPVSGDKQSLVLVVTPRRGQQEGKEVSRRGVNAIAAEQIRGRRASTPLYGAEAGAD